jgi:uncharacterized protein YdhG (YjbR/CyaY superfamily)
MATSNDKRNAAEGTFSEEERSAMRERAQELKAGTKSGEEALFEKIAELSQPERGMAERLHEIIMAAASDLSPKTWYGMPAYANKDGKVVCFFQPASKFDSRYATLGFSDTANLDDGAMWPTTFALKELGATEEARVTELVVRAVS